MAGSPQKLLLLYGCCGDAASYLCAAFRKRTWQVVGCDVNKVSCSPGPDHFVHVEGPPLLEQGDKVTSDLQPIMKQLGRTHFDAIVNLSGGFALGGADSPSFLHDSYRMVSNTVGTSIICANLATKFLKPSGLMILPGALIALNATPKMLAYGASKAFVHQMVQSLAEPGSGMPANSRVMGLLPLVLDTPTNRKTMPEADKSNWTPLEDLARLVTDACEQPTSVQNGGLYGLKTEGGKTKWTEVNVI
ncbi:unnamed protein product [Vitrella brassicaformis CCMP3155]|uniref:Dihydropteridine reductase n=3 Tax=Vitrella brassicaformis TaxID=1169539 RepID=A0A0G4F8M7_VITBC|nr:unnamed protein product [Vitrella brassicaformis CCMP3155]|mmetsp:Transcript_23583/g.58292  ORF Transcript_23583/g.58292 Transcript_23583/m.58292 type:complete len:247 (+) Transcript_23583:120-860(+)|eukprot:CEM09097.1 unnamed protein product [Vitrella brassicaformis CCMP3155]